MSLRRALQASAKQQAKNARQQPVKATNAGRTFGGKCKFCAAPATVLRGKIKLCRPCAAEYDD